MPCECPFCYRTYENGTEHYCEEREMWENTMAGQAKEARKALRNFSKTIMEEAIKSRKSLEKWIKDNDLFKKT